MARSIAALMVILASASLAAAQPPKPSDDEGPVVVSWGEGLVKRAPDRAWVNVTVESRARGPREAQKENAEAMAAVLQKLRGLGLPPDAIQTRGYDLQPEYDYEDGRRRLRGYLARNTVEVRIDELPRVGEVLDVAVGSGATSVGGIRFDLKDRSAAERDALRLAVEDARARAAAAASAAGMKVERVVRIEEHRTSDVEPPRPMMMAMRDGAAESAAPPVEPGELDIRAAVTITAAIR